MKNLLAGEKSPYLLQHKDNPVWWQPWSPEAFALAKNQNKPIFLSVGYSTCHWCHVMEKDSFEKTDVAQLINQFFIPVKVDREERPDVDSLYMNAVQAMTGHGGWPMTVLLTPDGKPFWGGTFIPQAQLKDLVTKAGGMWQTNIKDLTEGGERLAEFLKERSQPTAGRFKAHAAGPMKLFFESYREKFDTIHGGNYGAPKFPPALSLMMLLRIYRRTGDGAALHMVTQTLDQMRRGGIYDQVGGGFHRYSVDDHWLVPHFEKMLYDNALMTTTYLEAFQVTRKNDYAQTARETLDYVLRDMTSLQGGYFSAEDADSEQIEGKFYVWSEQELKEVLNPAEFEKLRKVFNISADGNFHAHRTGDEVTEKRHGPPAIRGNIFYLQPDFELNDLKGVHPTLEKLLKAREKRIRPHLDDKILASWNGLMISAMALGAKVLGDKKYARAAAKACEFIWNHMRDDEGHLLRTWRDGESRHRAMGDDYSFFIAGLLDLYGADFNLKWVDRARELHRMQTELFWDEKSGSFFDSDGRDPHLITRAKNFEDNVVPAANSVAALNALRLYDFTGDNSYRAQAETILGGANVFIEKYPGAIPKLLQCVDRLTDIDFELVAVGDIPPSFFHKINQEFLPNFTLAWSQKDFESDLALLKERTVQKNEPTFYLCEKQTCSLPSHNAENILEQIKAVKQFALT